jgi:hypothetical protein
MEKVKKVCRSVKIPLRTGFLMRVGHSSMKRGVGQFHTTRWTLVMVSARDQRQQRRIGPGDAAIAAEGR